MFEVIFKKLEKTNEDFKKNVELNDFVFLINHRLIIEAHQIIINYISCDIPLNYFKNTKETKKYFENIYKDLYISENQEGKMSIRNTVKILKWYYGETDNYKKLEKEINYLYKARNKINHSNQSLIARFSTFEETKSRLKKIEKLIKLIIRDNKWKIENIEL